MCSPVGQHVSEGFQEVLYGRKVAGRVSLYLRLPKMQLPPAPTKNEKTFQLWLANSLYSFGIDYMPD